MTLPITSKTNTNFGAYKILQKPKQETLSPVMHLTGKSGELFQQLYSRGIVDETGLLIGRYKTIPYPKLTPRLFAQFRADVDYFLHHMSGPKEDFPQILRIMGEYLDQIRGDFEYVRQIFSDLEIEDLFSEDFVIQPSIYRLKGDIVVVKPDLDISHAFKIYHPRAKTKTPFRLICVRGDMRMFLINDLYVELSPQEGQPKSFEAEGMQTFIDGLLGISRTTNISHIKDANAFFELAANAVSGRFPIQLGIEKALCDLVKNRTDSQICDVVSIWLKHYLADSYDISLAFAFMICHFLDKHLPEKNVETLWLELTKGDINPLKFSFKQFRNCAFLGDVCSFNQHFLEIAQEEGKQVYRLPLREGAHLLLNVDANAAWNYFIEDPFGFAKFFSHVDIPLHTLDDLYHVIEKRGNAEKAFAFKKKHLCNEKEINKLVFSNPAQAMQMLAQLMQQGKISEIPRKTLDRWVAFLEHPAKILPQAECIALLDYLKKQVLPKVSLPPPKAQPVSGEALTFLQGLMKKHLVDQLLEAEDLDFAKFNELLTQPFDPAKKAEYGKVICRYLGASLKEQKKHIFRDFKKNQPMEGASLASFGLILLSECIKTDTALAYQVILLLLELPMKKEEKQAFHAALKEYLTHEPNPVLTYLISESLSIEDVLSTLLSHLVVAERTPVLQSALLKKTEEALNIKLPSVFAWFQFVYQHDPERAFEFWRANRTYCGQDIAKDEQLWSQLGLWLLKKGELKLAQTLFSQRQIRKHLSECESSFQNALKQAELKESLQKVAFSGKVARIKSSHAKRQLSREQALAALFALLQEEWTFDAYTFLFSLAAEGKVSSEQAQTYAEMMVRFFSLERSPSQKIPKPALQKIFSRISPHLVTSIQAPVLLTHLCQQDIRPENTEDNARFCYAAFSKLIDQKTDAKALVQFAEFIQTLYFSKYVCEDSYCKALLMLLHQLVQIKDYESALVLVDILKLFSLGDLEEEFQQTILSHFNELYSGKTETEKISFLNEVSRKELSIDLKVCMIEKITRVLENLKGQEELQQTKPERVSLVNNLFTLMERYSGDFHTSAWQYFVHFVLKANRARFLEAAKLALEPTKQDPESIKAITQLVCDYTFLQEPSILFEKGYESYLKCILECDPLNQENIQRFVNFFDLICKPLAKEGQSLKLDANDKKILLRFFVHAKLLQTRANVQAIPIDPANTESIADRILLTPEFYATIPENTSKEQAIKDYVKTGEARMVSQEVFCNDLYKLDYVEAAALMCLLDNWEEEKYREKLTDFLARPHLAKFWAEEINCLWASKFIEKSIFPEQCAQLIFPIMFENNNYDHLMVVLYFIVHQQYERALECILEGFRQNKIDKQQEYLEALRLLFVWLMEEAKPEPAKKILELLSFVNNFYAEEESTNLSVRTYLILFRFQVYAFLAKNAGQVTLYPEKDLKCLTGFRIDLKNYIGNTGIPDVVKEDLIKGFMSFLIEKEKTEPGVFSDVSQELFVGINHLMRNEEILVSSAFGCFNIYLSKVYTLIKERQVPIFPYVPSLINFFTNLQVFYGSYRDFKSYFGWINHEKMDRVLFLQETKINDFLEILDRFVALPLNQWYPEILAFIDFFQVGAGSLFSDERYAETDKVELVKKYTQLALRFPDAPVPHHLSTMITFIKSLVDMLESLGGETQRILTLKSTLYEKLIEFAKTRSTDSPIRLYPLHLLAHYSPNLFFEIQAQYGLAGANAGQVWDTYLMQWRALPIDNFPEIARTVLIEACKHVDKTEKSAETIALLVAKLGCTLNPDHFIAVMDQFMDSWRDPSYVNLRTKVLFEISQSWLQVKLNTDGQFKIHPLIGEKMLQYVKTFPEDDKKNLIADFSKIKV